MGESPGGLTVRAARFIRARTQRAVVDAGLTGDALRAQIAAATYGRSDEVSVDLLERLQSRYGGLSYLSGLFGSQVCFAPVCEPEDPGEELEILYAVESHSLAGASVKRTGEVELGLDGSGVVEFVGLDSLIECDAVFDVAGALPVKETAYLPHAAVDQVRAALLARPGLGLRPVPEASGRRSFWLRGERSWVFLTCVWAELGSPLPPVLHVWSEDEDTAARVVDAARWSGRRGSAGAPVAQGEGGGVAGEDDDVEQVQPQQHGDPAADLVEPAERDPEVEGEGGEEHEAVQEPGQVRGRERPDRQGGEPVG